MDVSIVIPAYNEEGRIIPTLEKICSYFQSAGMSFEVVVVDDGSKDGTVRTVTQWQKNKLFSSPLRGEDEGGGEIVRIISHPVNMGKGAAVRTGVLAAKGNLILFSDADLSTPIEEFEKLRRVMDEGYDVAIGSRGLSESDVKIKQNLLRRMIGVAGSYMIKLMVIKRFADTQCGFKMFSNEKGKLLFRRQKIQGFAFDVELLYRAVRRNYRIKEVPVVWMNSVVSRVDTVRDPLRVLRDLFRIRTGF